MRKCIKIIITDFGDVDMLYSVLKKKLNFAGIEGIATSSDDEVYMIVYGPKEEVNSFVEDLEIVLDKESSHRKTPIGVLVEPYFKEEDYRGVFRFIKMS